GYENSTWHGWLAPAGLPPAILNRLSAELVKAAKAPDLQEKLATDGGEGVGATPEEFTRHLVPDLARWRKEVTAAWITPEDCGSPGRGSHEAPWPAHSSRMIRAPATIAFILP